MKKIFYLLVNISFLILAYSWHGTEAAEKLSPKRIVTSFYPMYIMTCNVTEGVEAIEVSNLTSSVTGCLHDYSLSTEDMKKLSEADILVANGAGLESFIGKALAQNRGLKVIRVSDGIRLIRGASGDNPHVWVSISGAMQEVRNLGKALAEADPSNAALYENNTETYVSKLGALRAKMREELAPYRGAKIVTFHEAFSYFAEEFEFEIVAVVEREPGSVPSAKELARIADTIRHSQARTIFCEPQYPDRVGRSLTKETGAAMYMLDPAVTGETDPDAYLRIMENNLRTLKKAFGDGRAA